MEAAIFATVDVLRPTYGTALTTCQTGSDVSAWAAFVLPCKPIKVMRAAAVSPAASWVCSCETSDAARIRWFFAWMPRQASQPTTARPTTTRANTDRTTGLRMLRRARRLEPRCRGRESADGDGSSEVIMRCGRARESATRRRADS